jgi:hypothetical protein
MGDDWLSRLWILFSARDLVRTAYKELFYAEYFVNVFAMMVIRGRRDFQMTLL